MTKLSFIHWQDQDGWIGYLTEYPDYWTQGESLDDLMDHLRDLYLDLSSDKIPHVRKLGELMIP
jgi:predicted RNase H-like HicB family nuclease